VEVQFKQSQCAHILTSSS